MDDISHQYSQIHISQLNTGGDRLDGVHILREASNMEFSKQVNEDIAKQVTQINVFEPLFTKKNKGGDIEYKGQEEALQESIDEGKTVILTGSELTLTEKDADLERATQKSEEDQSELKKIYNRADLLSLSAVEYAKNGGNVLAICYGFQSVINHLNPNWIKSSGDWIVGRNTINIPKGFGGISSGEYSITSSFKDIVLIDYQEDENGNSVIEDDEKIIHIIRDKAIELENFNERVKPVSGIFIKYKGTDGTILAFRDHPELTKNAYDFIFKGNNGVIAKREKDPRFNIPIIQTALSQKEESESKPSIDIVTQYLQKSIHEPSPTAQPNN